MTRSEAQRALLLYQPGTDTLLDPELSAAVELARTDPELGQWLEQHLAFQQAMRTRLRNVPVPPHLKDAILADRKIVPMSFWQRPPAWLAAAAALGLLLGLAVLLFHPRPPDRFADFRTRMVRTALRQYSMDIITNDMQQVRQFMASRGAPADYSLPPGLQKLSLTGGGRLTWRSQPVSMVCFDRGDDQMLFLFVLDRTALPDPPSGTPELARVNKLTTVSWSEGNRTYVLAGPEEPDFASKYL